MLGSTNIIAFIPTRDSNQARAFYEGILGLRFVKDDGFALVFDANSIMVRIAKAPEFKPLQFTILGWQVSNIEKMAADLQKKGVNFERFGFFEQDELGIWTAPSGDKVAWFKDPDGNMLSISQHV
jgi:catechol 2,3-dioxygenase-like lactoylglutathione lyase family enzyme